MGPSPIIGYGKYHYKSASGREGDWFTIGLVSGKTGTSLHICVGGEAATSSRRRRKLGKVKTGRSCINFTKLETFEARRHHGARERSRKIRRLKRREVEVA